MSELKQRQAWRITEEASKSAAAVCRTRCWSNGWICELNHENEVGDQQTQNLQRKYTLLSLLSMCMTHCTINYNRLFSSYKFEKMVQTTIQ